MNIKLHSWEVCFVRVLQLIQIWQMLWKHGWISKISDNVINGLVSSTNSVFQLLEWQNLVASVPCLLTKTTKLNPSEILFQECYSRLTFKLSWAFPLFFQVVNWETKQLCPPRQPGQIIVLGPQVSPSYYKNPKATSELLDANGFVKTGDAGFYDEIGRIYVLDRIKDIIKCKGTLVRPLKVEISILAFQICPSEVELVLRAHVGIDDCAVVGRQDHVTGEVPAAFVVKNPAHPLLASAEVRQYVSGLFCQKEKKSKKSTFRKNCNVQRTSGRCFLHFRDSKKCVWKDSEKKLASVLG